MEDPRPSPGDWNVAERMAFRFTLAYLVLFLSQGSDVGSSLVLWAATTVLSLDIPFLPSGSGDTTFNYVQLLCFVCVALLATLVWSLVDRRTKSHPHLHDSLRTAVRYVLAFVLVFYGTSKVFPLQFPPLSAEQLSTPYGDSSPMGLLWRFMGYSTAYAFFVGATEVVAGLLLLSRRTTTLGGLATIAVMSNVVMLNFCYDVPAKVLSVHLLGMAAFLVLPDLRRLADLLVLNRPTLPQNIHWAPTTRWIANGRVALKLLVVSLIVVVPTAHAANAWRARETRQPDRPADQQCRLFQRGFHWVNEYPYNH